MKLISDSPAGNNQTFAVAGGIVHIVLHSDEKDFARTLAAAIQRAFNWPEVYCQFNGRAKHLSDRHKLSEDWRALAERAEREDQAAWLPSGGQDSESIQLCCPLLARDEMIGALCVRAPLTVLPTL